MAQQVKACGMHQAGVRVQILAALQIQLIDDASGTSSCKMKKAMEIMLCLP